MLWPYDRKRVEALQKGGCPKDVPWALVEAHEEQALMNHGQSVRRLAHRGGLDPLELVAVLTDRSWPETDYLSDAEAVDLLVGIIEESRKGQKP